VVAQERLLLVGTSPLLEDIAQYIAEHPETGLQVVGYVGDREKAGTAKAGGEVLGPMASLREIIQATSANRIVMGVTERRTRMPVSELLDLRFAGPIIEEAASTYEKVCGRVCLKELRPSQLIYAGELGPRRASRFYQTVSNLITAAIAVVLATPIMLLTALAVRLTSAGPVLCRQTRVGMDGIPFTLYKFRSMRTYAETSAVSASKGDPRITPLGRTLRRLRIDQIPELFNVLKGDMSMVGPRPERPEMVQYLSQKIPYYGHRHCVRPGITGWARINRQEGDTLEDVIQKLEYDLYYIKNMSLSLDSYILLLAIKTTILSSGSQ
jgi:exopolysaccharide biosynthesis polyprenyl glycosylphosphotransferase